MGVPRSVRLRFTARVAAPVIILIAAWVAFAIVVKDGKIRRLTTGKELLAVTGAGAAVLIIALLLTAVFVARLSRDVSGLATAASEIADGRDTTFKPASRETARAVDAIVSVRHSAQDATAAETRLRDGLRQVLVSLGKRNQSLLHRQLRIIDELEKQAASPQALADLFALDHLTTRMRRHAESLTIVAGSGPARAGSDAVPVIDVIRAAAAEVEDYRRVTVITDAEEAVAAPAVTDMIHMLAELIENATLFSPSATRVEVKAEAVANGFAIEVEDRGLGIAPEQLVRLNEQLDSPPDFDVADADRLGLFVVGRLAARHGVQVSLNPSAYRGTKAVVILPESIVTEPPAEEVRPAPTQRRRAAELATVQETERPPLPERRPEPAPAPADEPESGRTLHGLPRRVRPDAQPSDTQPSDTEPASDGDSAGGALPTRQGRSHPAEAPAPEHARNLAASLQSSWQRSRHDPESEDN
ncbi:MAG: sensor histidine kinase [Streptosporangiaceae bacterium]|jgi:signal transduction histidine kinase